MSVDRNSDRYAWSMETARALRTGDLAHVDTLAVAEELEQVGRSDAHELRSRIIQIIEHLLKLTLTEGPLLEQNQRGWRLSVVTQQQEIDFLLHESPSLKLHLTAEFLTDCYSKARTRFNLALDQEAAEDCPFGWTDVLSQPASHRVSPPPRAGRRG